MLEGYQLVVRNNYDSQHRGSGCHDRICCIEKYRCGDGRIIECG